MRRPALVLGACCLAQLMVVLDVTIVNTALNAIGKALEGGVSELQWVVSAYTIAFAAFILTAGALGDRIGAKRVFMGASLFSQPRRSSARSLRTRPFLSRRVVFRALPRQCWCRTLLRCSTTPIPMSARAEGRSEYGPPARAWP